MNLTSLEPENPLKLSWLEKLGEISNMLGRRIGELAYDSFRIAILDSVDGEIQASYWLNLTLYESWGQAFLSRAL